MPRAFLLKSRSWEGQTTTEADVHHTEIAMERTCDEESGNVFGSFVNSRDPSVMTHKGHTGQVLSNSKLRICTNGAAYRLSEMATGEVLLPLRPLVQTKGQGRLLSPSGPRPIAGGRECVDVCSSTEDLIQYDMQTFGEGGPDMSRDKHVLSESQRTDDDDDDSCDEIDVMNNDDDDDIDVDICDVSGDDEVFAQEVNRRVINPDDVPESQVPQVIHKHSPFFESRDDLPTHLHQPEVSRNALQEGPPGGAAFHPEVHEHEVSHQSRRGQKTLNIIPVECLPSTQHFAPNHGQGVPNREPEEPSSTPEVRDTSPSDELRTPAGGHSDPEQRPPLTPSPPISEGQYRDRNWKLPCRWHYSEVIMSAMVSQITGVSMVCSNVCSGADQRKYQSSASLAFVKGIHRWPVNSLHKGPVARKISHSMTSYVVISINSVGVTTDLR